MDEFNHAVGQVAGEVGAVVGRSIFAQPASDKDFGEAVAQRQLDVGVGLVVAQQDVEAGLALLDEVVFKRQGFVFVGDENVVEVDGFAHERAGFGVGLRGLEQIGTYARAEIFGFADVNHLTLGVFVEIHAWLDRQRPDFPVKVHR